MVTSHNFEIFKEWQSKWENSPRTNSRDKLSNLSALELDKAYIASTSLPENLDCPSEFQEVSTRRKKTINTVKHDSNISGSNATLQSNISTRSQLLPKIPRSTGKFGTSKQPSLESLVVELPPLREHRLETITENPMSRPTTVESTRLNGSVKKPRDYPNCLLDSEANHKSPTSSHSTASVGGIDLNQSFRTLSSSHLSASSVSIFDNPTWLQENKQSHTDNVFQFMKNLHSGFKQNKDKDSKWFTKSHPRPQETRRDLEFNSLRTKQYTGLNSAAVWNINRSQSLQIIRKGKHQESTEPVHM